MSTTQILIVVVVLLLITGAVALYARRRRSQQLRSQFGPEYLRAVEDRGGPAKAEQALQAREKRVKGYDLKPLSPDAQRRFAAEWSRIQALFVDSPTDATAQADHLLGQVMSAKGYPDGPFDQRLEDLSVKHAEAVQGYREAHGVQQRRAQGKASTEDERRAMLDYRRLFNELAGAPDAPAANPRENVRPETRTLRAVS